MVGARLIPVFSMIGLLTLWVMAAFLTEDAQILPTPWQLGPPLAQELASGELLIHLGATIVRVIWAFKLAMTLGVALGLVMGWSPAVNA